MSLFEKLQELKKHLKKEIFGQKEAIDQLIDALLHIHLSPITQNYKGLFTFIGPHNSGKVYTAKLLSSLCEEFEGFELFNMAQFTDPNDQKKLLAALSKFLKRDKKGIIVFKDIEKADNVIQLAILNAITSRHNELDLSQTLIIFTTTLGSNLLKKEAFLRFYKKERLQAEAKIVELIAKEKKIIYDIVENAIDPELLSLIVQNYIILFRHLDWSAIVKVGEKIFKETLVKLRESTATTIKAHKGVTSFLILSLAPYINARRVHKKIPDLLIDLLAQAAQKFGKLPSTVTIEIAPQALKFLEQVDEAFLERVAKRNETVSLRWRYHKEPATLRITLVSAHLKRLPLYATPIEKPQIGYSEIGFEDIAGQRHVKESLKEIIAIVTDPQKVKRFGINRPKGLLLTGPKGVGKSMLAFAFAKEANFPFVLLSGSELHDIDLIHLAYQKARELSPAILFLDELDSSGDLSIPYDTIAKEIDAVNEEEYVLTLVTAMDKNDIDSTLLSSERIDLIIEVPELDMEARKFFVKKILQKPNDGKIDVERVARYMSGLSGYEMQRVAKEAALYALRKGLALITEEILIEQINNIKYGQKVDKRRIRNLEKDLKKTAYHEAGHAVLSYVLLPDVKIEQVTITPRAQTLGFVSYSDDFISNISKEELFNDICVSLAGRISKLKKFPEEGEDTGAAQDLEQATWEAYNLVATFGMDETIGYIHIDTLTQNVSKELYRKALEERIAYWMDKATKRAKELVERYWEQIEKVAQALIKKEMIDGEELRSIMQE